MSEEKICPYCNERPLIFYKSSKRYSKTCGNIKCSRKRDYQNKAKAKAEELKTLKEKGLLKICPYCNERPLIFYKISKRYSKTCGNIDCMRKHRGVKTPRKSKDPDQYNKIKRGVAQYLNNLYTNKMKEDRRFFYNKRKEFTETLSKWKEKIPTGLLPYNPLYPLPHRCKNCNAIIHKRFETHFCSPKCFYTYDVCNEEGPKYPLYKGIKADPELLIKQPKPKPKPKPKPIKKTVRKISPQMGHRTKTITRYDLKHLWE